MRKYYSLEKIGKSAEIDIFGDITSLPFLESDVSSYSLQKEIQELTDVDEINVHINSYGGEVAEALAITNTLARHPAKVTTYVDGFACSAATIIFMAGERRVVSSLSNFLVHPAWSYMEGNAEDLRREADDLDRITDQSVKAYMARINKSEEELRELMQEERFMTPEEVLEWGFATEIDNTLEAEKPSQSARKLVFGKVQDNALSADDSDLEDINAQLDVIQTLCEDIKAAVVPDESGDEPEEPDEPESPEDPDEEPENNDEPEKEAPSYMERFFNAFN